jgi:5-methylcytosine-specific restriction endonuclease McrA
MHYWGNYLEKSISSPKLPIDWLQRKEFAWRRDNKCCNRCGKDIQLNEVHNIFVNEIKNGGGYNLENIITLCVDCNKILNTKNSRNNIFSIPLSDKLLMLVKEE